MSYGIILTITDGEEETPKTLDYIYHIDLKSAVSILITDTLTNIRGTNSSLTKVVVIDQSVTPHKTLDNSEIFDILISI